jgi:hypothetical protein
MADHIEEFIERTLSIVQLNIETDAIDAVKHYLYHGEYEIAFEGLFIEIMQLEKVPPIDLHESKRIAMQLKLHEESVRTSISGLSSSCFFQIIKYNYN